MDIQAATMSQVKAELTELDMTQADLAKAIGASNSAVSRYLKGERDISFPDTVKMAEALNLTYFELVTRAQRRLDAKADAKKDPAA